MGALNWLQRLRSNEGGNIIALGAAAMPMLIASAAMAVDTIQLSLMKRELQRAADSGAIAGAYALAQKRSDAQIRTSVIRDLADNPHPTLVGTTIVRGARAGQGRAVYVSLTAERSLPFMNMFTNSPARVSADATAAIVTQGRYCMVSLYEGTDPGITLGGNATITLGCGMITNSRAESAITTGGAKSYIEATPVAAVGGIDGEDNNFVGDTDLIPYTAPQADPFAGVPNPEPCTTVINATGLKELEAGKCYSSLTVKPSETVIIKGSGPVTIYGGNIDIKGDVAMAPGSTGVTIVMTGPKKADGTVSAGTLEMSSQANLSLSPPEDGPYANLVFYRDRRAPWSEIKVRGGADSFIEGAFYAPTSDFDFAGNSGFEAECLQMVGRKIGFTGTSDLVNECPDGSDVSPVTRTIVRLVE